jgi:CRISPR-associated protein Csx14
MGRAVIPVDLRNPGQVFACLGFLEAAEVLCGSAQGGFEWDNGETFLLDAAGENDPVAAVLEFLRGCTVNACSPAETRSDRFGVATIQLDGQESPAPALKDSELPVRLSHCGRVLRLEHWADGCHLRDKVKFWGGAGGYSGAARTRDLIQAFRSMDAGPADKGVSDPFNAAGFVSSGFRLEMRRDYVPIDLGFSVNSHNDMRIVG